MHLGLVLLSNAESVCSLCQSRMSLIVMPIGCRFLPMCTTTLLGKYTQLTTRRLMVAGMCFNEAWWLLSFVVSSGNTIRQRKEGKGDRKGGRGKRPWTQEYYGIPSAFLSILEENLGGLELWYNNTPLVINKSILRWSNCPMVAHPDSTHPSMTLGKIIIQKARIWIE